MSLVGFFVEKVEKSFNQVESEIPIFALVYSLYYLCLFE